MIRRMLMLSLVLLAGTQVGAAAAASAAPPVLSLDGQWLLAVDPQIAQRLLFDQDERKRQTRLAAVADQVKERFGGESLRRGSSLERSEKHDR